MTKKKFWLRRGKGRENKNKWKGTLYWKSLALVLVISCLPALLIGIGVYQLSGEPIVRKLNEAHQTQLDQSIDRVDEYLSILELLSARLAFNPDFDESLAGTNYGEQFQKTRDLYRSLSLMKDGNPLLFDVAIYLEKSDTLISDYWGVRSFQGEQKAKPFRDLLGSGNQIFWTDDLPRADQHDQPNKGVVVKLQNSNEERAYGAFLIYMNQGALDRLIRSLAFGGGTAFLMERDGRVVAAGDAGDPGPDEELIRRIVRLNTFKDTFGYEKNGISYSVSFGRLSRLGNDWVYVSVTPLSAITAPVNVMSQMILAVCAVGIILALLLAWLASSRLYGPIRRLVGLFHSPKETRTAPLNEIMFIERQWRHHLDEREAVQERLQRSLPSLRERFLLDFFQGRTVARSERDIAERLRQYDWNVDGKRFALLLAGLYWKETSGPAFSERDERLIDYAAANIMQELCKSTAEFVHTIDFQDSRVGALLALNSSSPADPAKAELLEIAANIAASANSLLNVNVTVAVSKLSESILTLPEMMEEMSKMLRLRDPKETAGVLDMEDFMPVIGQSFEFPLELERSIIHAMQTGLEEEAGIGLRLFVEEIRGKSGTRAHIRQGMLKLLGSVYEALFQSGVNPDSVYGGAYLYEKLMAIRHPEDMIRWFAESVIAPFARFVSASDPETRRLVARVVEELHRELSSDVSLDMYADRYGVSPFKLSRAFKQMTGANFIDYLVGLRIEKCKELLVTTDMKINEIAELLRYQPSYLIRLFKKSTKMTPGQFREKYMRGTGEKAFE